MNALEAPRHIFFVGIAGIGVSALAQISAARGTKVSGSDPNVNALDNPAMDRLRSQGAALFAEHRAENVSEDVDLIVATAAVSASNPEVQEAVRRSIRIVSRAQFLGELMAAHQGIKIAVSGTHGKTTTTGMLGVILDHAGLDPTVFVGGEVADLGGNVRIGSSNGPFVAEACEAYDSFLWLKPDIAVVTNIEADHLDHYVDFDGVKRAFARFLSGVSNSGGVVYCRDDIPSSAVVQGLTGSAKTVAYSVRCGSSDLPLADSVGKDIIQEAGAKFTWRCDGDEIAVSLAVPGVHNVANAVAAATAAHLVGVRAGVTAEGLGLFHGATRRQDILGCVDFETSDVIVMDDYAHHPTEIEATLKALREAYPARRLVAIFQPHLYSRTRDFLEEFGTALATADSLIVTDIYAARETPLPGVDASEISRLAVRAKPRLVSRYVADRHEIPALLNEMCRAGDLIIFLGAGDIREQAESLLTLLQARRI